jgi:hypothetical protein
MRSAKGPIKSTGRRATIVVDLGEIRVYLVEPTQAAQSWEWYEAATVGCRPVPDEPHWRCRLWKM